VGGVGVENVPDMGRLGGVVTAAELTRAGITSADIRLLVRRGVLTKIDWGVYARKDLAEPLAATLRGGRLLRIAGAVATVGPGSVASHHDAAVIHGLALLDKQTGLLTVSRPRGVAGGRTEQAGIRVHRCLLPDDQVVIRNRIAVTSVARTVVDLARTSPFRSGVVVADSALHDRKTTDRELRAVVAGCARWPGVDRARRVVEFSDARSESPFESIARVAFRDGGLPPPELQIWVGGDSRGVIGRADFLWREHSTIAEADGAVKYADPDRARKQLRRDADLREAGFEVVHFTWHELAAAPRQVIDSIRAAFRRASLLRSAGRTSA
jgi:hypothetical protein